MDGHAYAGSAKRAHVPNPGHRYQAGTPRPATGASARVPSSTPSGRPPRQAGPYFLGPSQNHLRSWVLLASAHGVRPRQDAEIAARFLGAEAVGEQEAGHKKSQAIDRARVA